MFKQLVGVQVWEKIIIISSAFPFNGAENLF